MREYPKIETLFDRGPGFKVDTTRVRCREFALITSWYLTEKIDGTNIRLVYGPDGFAVMGRTDNAQIHSGLIQVCSALEPSIAAWYAAHFPAGDGTDAFPSPTCILFGEGYGPKIQTGGGYRKDGQAFRLFDVLVENKWLDWNRVIDVADETGIPTAPIVAEWEGTAGINAFIRDYTTSATATLDCGDGCRPEGVVARTVPYLYDWRGHRIMWKLKHKDLP